MLAITTGGIMMSQTGLDIDAAAFLNASGITDSTIKSAVNALVISAKANGWWTLCNAIYPFVGGTSTTCKYNLKDPRDADAAFRLTFVGTPGFAATGATWSASNYADSHLAPSTTLSQNSVHMSICCRTSTPPGAFGGSAIGGNNSTKTYFEIGWDSGGTPTRMFYGLNSIVDSAVANQARNGLTTVTRNASNNILVYFNGTQVANTAEVSGSQSTLSIYVGAYHEDPAGTADGFDAGEYSFMTIGADVSAVQSVMYDDILRFNTALSR